MSDDRDTPSWRMLDAARRALQPVPVGLADLTDAQVLTDLAQGYEAAGQVAAAAVVRRYRDCLLAGLFPLGVGGA